MLLVLAAIPVVIFEKHIFSLILDFSHLDVKRPM